MSRLRANQITNENANGAPNFPHGITVTGIVTATNTQTTFSNIVVGSAVTANSNGVDTVGIVTAGTLKDKAGGTFAPNPTTTRGDIIIRGVSVNERLAIGTAGQVLKVNAGANGLEYGTDVGGKILQVVATNISATSSLAIPNGSTGTTTSPVNVTITSTVLNSKFLISGMVNGEANNMPDIYFYPITLSQLNFTLKGTEDEGIDIFEVDEDNTYIESMSFEFEITYLINTTNVGLSSP